MKINDEQKPYIIFVTPPLSTCMFVDGKVYGNHIKSIKFVHGPEKEQDLEIVCDKLPLEPEDTDIEKFRNAVLKLIDG